MSVRTLVAMRRCVDTRTFDNASITHWSQRRLAPEVEVFKDGMGPFGLFVDVGHAHSAIRTVHSGAVIQALGAH